MLRALHKQHVARAREKRESCAHAGQQHLLRLLLLFTHSRHLFWILVESAPGERTSESATCCLIANVASDTCRRLISSVWPLQHNWQLHEECSTMIDDVGPRLNAHCTRCQQLGANKHCTAPTWWPTAANIFSQRFLPRGSPRSHIT